MMSMQYCYKQVLFPENHPINKSCSLCISLRIACSSVQMVVTIVYYLDGLYSLLLTIVTFFLISKVTLSKSATVPRFPYKTLVFSPLLESGFTRFGLFSSSLPRVIEGLTWAHAFRPCLCFSKYSASRNASFKPDSSPGNFTEWMPRWPSLECMDMDLAVGNPRSKTQDLWKGRNEYTNI